MALIRRFALVATTLGALACGDNQDPAGAQLLLDEIRQLDYQNTFAKAPGYETAQPSNTSHSDFSDIFVNDIVDDAIIAAEPLTEWPLGSLVIKDGYDDDNELNLIAVMEKREDGWYWAEYLDPSADDGGAKFSGKPDVCISCHAVGSADDYTRAITLPK